MRLLINRQRFVVRHGVRDGAGFFVLFHVGFLFSWFLPRRRGGVWFFVFRFLFFRFFLGGFFKFVDERFFFFFAFGAFRDVTLAVEVDAPINQSFLNHGIGAQRIMIVNRQVGVLADVNGAHALIDAKLHRGIQRDHFESFVVRQAAELHALGGFLIQVRGFFGAVGIDGDDHAAAGHERGVVGNGGIGFDFGGPPIGKRGSADS